MNVRDAMTKDPACCTPDTKLEDVAKQMVEHDCGCLPVVDDLDSKRPVGVITDRDIVCRAVATGKDARTLTARECMTTPAVTIRDDSEIDDCCELMEAKQVRRVPVVDESGQCCGIVAQADIARREEPRVGRIVKAVSRPTATASNVR